MIVFTRSVFENNALPGMCLKKSSGSVVNGIPIAKVN